MPTGGFGGGSGGKRPMDGDLQIIPGCLKHPGEGLHLDIFSKLCRARNFVDEVKTEFKLYENTFCTAVASEVSQEMAETPFLS